MSSIRSIALWALCLMAVALAAPAQAQYARERVLPPSYLGSVTVPVYKSRIISLTTPANRVSVGNPDVADILVLGSSELYVLGKDLGATNVLLWDRGNNLISSLDVSVVHDLEGLKEQFNRLLPEEPIEVYSSRRSIVLSGRVSSLEKMGAAMQIARTYLEQAATAVEKDVFKQQAAQGGGMQNQERTVGEVINLMQVGGGQQVMLEVKVAEINRTELRRIDAQFNAIGESGNWMIGGVNGGASFPDALFGPDEVRIPVFDQNPLTGSPVQPIGPVIDEFAPADITLGDKGIFASVLTSTFAFNLAIDAAKDRGLAKILAEPTVTTMSGQEAEFLSGGRFPIPVPQDNNTITVEFEDFGVALRFLPVILNSGRINLKLNISVSEIVAQNSLFVTPAGSSATFVVPSLTERRALSTVELADGQTIGIAGLINEQMRQVVDQFPGLGSLPILGQLFRSQNFQKGESELVILVTPRLAKPLDPEDIRLPTDSFIEPDDIDFYLLGRMEGRRPEGGARGGGTGESFGHGLSTSEE